MADFIARSAQSTVSNGGVAIPGTNLRQELVTEENVARWTAEAKVFVANNGTVDTPYTVLNAVTAIATPGLAVRIPSGKYIIPLDVVMQFITGTTAPTNVTLVMYASDIGTGTSTAGVDQCNNSAFGALLSGCTVQKTYTGAGTAATNPLEFWRASSAIQAVATVGGLFRAHYNFRTDLAPRIGATGAIHTFSVNPGVAAAATAYITATYAVFNVGDN